MEMLNTVRELFAKLPQSFFDFIFVLFMVFFVFEEASFGLIASLFNFIATIVAFFVGIVGYSLVSRMIANTFHFSKGFSDALAFLLVAVIAWAVLRIGFVFLKKSLPQVAVPKSLDYAGGALFGVFSYLFYASFFFSLLLSFPVSKVVKDKVTSSFMGKYLVLRTNFIESSVHEIFGGAIEESLNFLTIKPESHESVPLYFSVQNPVVDTKAEKEMLKQVNAIRKSHNLSLLEEDATLQKAARDHARDMLQRKYFSHYTPEGYSPFDRLESQGVSYTTAAENLAFAPDTAIAMEGLMKSKGHRENILSPFFHKVGIGVMDAGIYGKMFVQEFTD